MAEDTAAEVAARAVREEAEAEAEADTAAEAEALPTGAVSAAALRGARAAETGCRAAACSRAAVLRVDSISFYLDRTRRCRAFWLR